MTTTFQTVNLARGRHTCADHGVCVMELASMLAGERFSDHPRAVCPVIGGYLRTLNDSFEDVPRQELYALAAEVVGSAAGVATRWRRRMLCRRRTMELRADGLSAAGRLLLRFLYGDAPSACAAAHADSGDASEAVAFVRELLAVGEHDQQALTPPAPERRPAEA